MSPGIAMNGRGIVAQRRVADKGQAQSAARAPSPHGAPATHPGQGRRGWAADPAQGFAPVFSADKHVGTALRETYRAFARSVSENVAPLGLTLSMWFALRCLWEEDGLSQVELARRIEMTAAAIVGLVNALEAAGLVTRQRAKDRRAFRVMLTTSGRALRTRASAQALQTDARAMRGLAVSEVEQLLRLLGQLRANLAEGRAASQGRGAKARKP
jgi:MarR family transcriptional regulator, organic hydroperoxide resistance regulator